MSATISSATFESSSGIKIQRVPLRAFPNFWATVYVVSMNEQHILIDAGSGTDDSHDDLLNGLSQAGLHPIDLTHILLTHAHIDHYGGLPRLRSLTDAKIGCHELDIQTVAHHETRLALLSRRLASFLADSGLAQEPQEQLLGIHRFTKALYRSVPVDFTYSTIKEQIPGLEVIHLPGHCPGHVAMRLEDVIFCGDMVVEGVTPHIAPESIQPNGGLDHYLESLDKFQEWAWGARLILNGHDDVITDLPARIGVTHQNLIRRMSKTVEALSQSLTVAEVCTEVYGEMGGYNQLLTIEKTGAYIEYLYERGMIEVTNLDEVEQGLPAKYRRLRVIPDDEILRKLKSPVLE